MVQVRDCRILESGNSNRSAAGLVDILDTGMKERQDAEKISILSWSKASKYLFFERTDQ